MCRCTKDQNTTFAIAAEALIDLTERGLTPTEIGEALSWPTVRTGLHALFALQVRWEEMEARAARLQGSAAT